MIKMYLSYTSSAGFLKQLVIKSNIWLGIEVNEEIETAATPPPPPQTYPYIKKHIFFL